MLCLKDSIRHDDPSVQRLCDALEDARTLSALVLAAWQLARVLAMHLVEDVLAHRGRCPTSWPRCLACGRSLRSKGFVKRQVLSLVGPIQWQRRVGQCPQGCATPHVAPLDEALGLRPHQRTSAVVRLYASAPPPSEMDALQDSRGISYITVGYLCRAFPHTVCGSYCHTLVMLDQRAQASVPPRPSVPPRHTTPATLAQERDDKVHSPCDLVGHRRRAPSRSHPRQTGKERWDWVAPRWTENVSVHACT